MGGCVRKVLQFGISSLQQFRMRGEFRDCFLLRALGLAPFSDIAKYQYQADDASFSLADGATMSSMGICRPALEISLIGLARLTIWRSRKTRLNRFSIAAPVASLLITKTCSRGWRIARSWVHPVNEFWATGFKKVTLPPHQSRWRHRRCSRSSLAASRAILRSAPRSAEDLG